MLNRYNEKEFFGCFETYAKANNEAIDLHMSYPLDYSTWEINEDEDSHETLERDLQWKLTQ